MPTNKRVISSGFWQLLDVIVLVVVQLIYFSIMARLLDKDAFGLMAITNSFVGIGIIFAESGMGPALIQRRNLTNRHITAALQGSFLFGSMLFILFIFIAPYAAIFFRQPELDNLIKVLSINFIFLSIGNASLGLLQRKFLFKKIFIIDTISAIIAYSAGIYLAYQGYGVWSLVIATLIFSLIKSTGFLAVAPLKFILGFHIKEWKDLFSFGFGLMLLRINNYVGSSGINLLLGKILNANLLGVFERTYRIKTLPSKYLGNVLDQVMFPVMAEVQNEKKRLFRIYQNSLGLVNSILIPVAVYLIFFAEEIVMILLGDKWTNAIIPLQIMFIVLPFSSSVRMADSVIRAKGLVYRNAWRKFLYVIVLLVSTGLGGYRYGLIGASVGVTFSYLFNYITMLFLVKSIFKKSIVEIFWQPVVIGLKLGFILLIVLVTITSLIQLWIRVNIFYFLIITLILSILTTVGLFYKPSLFGPYIEEMKDRISASFGAKLERIFQK